MTSRRAMAWKVSGKIEACIRSDVGTLKTDILYLTCRYNEYEYLE